MSLSSECERLVPLVSSLKAQQLQGMLGLALRYLAQPQAPPNQAGPADSPAPAAPPSLTPLETELLSAHSVLGLEERRFAVVFSAIFVALRFLFRYYRPPQNATTAQRDRARAAYVQDVTAALREAQLADAMIEIFTSCLRDNVEAMRSVLHAQMPRAPATVVSVRWRAEVALTTGTLNRVLRPAVLMELTFSDGSINTVELDAAAFQALRHSTAEALKEVEAIESLQVLHVDVKSMP